MPSRTTRRPPAAKKGSRNIPPSFSLLDGFSPFPLFSPFKTAKPRAIIANIINNDYYQRVRLWHAIRKPQKWNEMSDNRLRRKKPRWLLTTAAVGIFAALWNCGSDPPIRIGFIAGTSGRVADLGISGRDAVQMVVEEWNRGGGVKGRQVQLVFRDDRQDAETARSAVEELIGEGVAAIIGPMTSDMALAVTPITNASQTLIVSPTATTEALSGRDDFFFRVTGTTKGYAHLNAAYQINHQRMRRVAAAYDTGNRSFTENWLENFTHRLTEMGGEVIAAVGFDTRTGRTFLNIAQELLAAQPDGILIVANSMDSAILCQQIRKLDSQINITLADWGATERLLELGGNMVEGVTVVQTFDRNDPSPPYQAFRKAYMERYQREPGFPGVHAYDAIRVVLTALAEQKAGQTLKETLLAIGTFKGLQHEVAFDPYGDAKKPNASISIVRDGRFVVVEK